MPIDASWLIIVSPSGKLSGVSGLSKWRVVAAAIEADIQSGVHPVGTHLPSMRSLAERHQVGRATVQGAIRYLSERGLVRAAHGSGVEVISDQVTDIRTVDQVLETHRIELATHTEALAELRTQVAALEDQVRQLRDDR